ncbi:MAG: ribulose-phosphate 3-epimerase [Oscillospiraceae bacterium]|jgi:ribulose-phosphate 3-epimerase|nr:ribulose-phosphate 3-epimerase [Oscillospiraceae bacterium]
MGVLISSSILNSDLANLEQELRRAEDAGADMIHIDVMDGVFTDSITFGDYVVGNLRPHAAIPFDTHLMVNDPTKLIPLFAKAGSDIITIHEESRCDVAACLKLIRGLGKKAGISINPETDVKRVFPYLELCDTVLIMSVKPGAGGQAFQNESINKIKAVRSEADRLGLKLDISVDGGINDKTAALIFEAGANIAVVGTFLLGSDDYIGAMLSIRIAGS